MSLVTDPFSVLIVDDEALAREVMKEFLEDHEEVGQISESSDGFQAVRDVAEKQPDIVFLDIEMPKLNGFEALELMDPRPVPIFVTAYDQYALRAFEVHAVDYILKPFSKERFSEALKRAEREARAGGVRRPAATALSASARPPSRFLTRLAIKDGLTISVLPVSKIDYIEAQDDYIRAVANGKGHMKQMALSEVEAQLDPARFLRVHRSYIVNIDRLSRLEPGGRGSFTAILNDGTDLPVSRAGASRLRELFAPRKPR